MTEDSSRFIPPALEWFIEMLEWPGCPDKFRALGADLRRAIVCNFPRQEVNRKFKRHQMLLPEVQAWLATSTAVLIDPHAIHPEQRGSTRIAAEQSLKAIAEIIGSEAPSIAWGMGVRADGTSRGPRRGIPQLEEAAALLVHLQLEEESKKRTEGKAYRRPTNTELAERVAEIADYNRDDIRKSARVLLGARPGEEDKERELAWYLEIQNKAAACISRALSRGKDDLTTKVKAWVKVDRLYQQLRQTKEEFKEISAHQRKIKLFGSPSRNDSSS
jgi:hypothetical protein